MDFTKYTIIAIAITVYVDYFLRGKIQKREKFNGIAWAILLNIIVGVNIWAVLILALYFDEKREIKKIDSKTKKEKNYKEYAYLELQDFKTTYIVFSFIQIILVAAFIILARVTPG